jgi:guanylate kinase
MTESRVGKLLVLTGETAAGKTTVGNILLQTVPDLQRIVTHTSRDPRPGEVNGKDYWFHKVWEFEDLKDQGYFFEYVKYAGNEYKGTAKTDLLKVLEGQSLLWIIDPSRAATIHQDLKERLLKDGEVIAAQTVVAYLKAPSQDVQIQRYLDRQPSANISVLRDRVEQDARIFRKYGFKNVFVNEDGQQEVVTSEIAKLIAS